MLSAGPQGGNINKIKIYGERVTVYSSFEKCECTLVWIRGDSALKVKSERDLNVKYNLVPKVSCVIRVLRKVSCEKGKEVRFLRCTVSYSLFLWSNCFQVSCVTIRSSGTIISHHLSNPSQMRPSNASSPLLSTLTFYALTSTLDVQLEVQECC